MDPAKAQVGSLLYVIHNFTARSSDELSLIKGDIVELLERDDEFGDGWYNGRHCSTGRQGLFPAVYTNLKTPESSKPRKSGSLTRPSTREGVRKTDTEIHEGGVGIRQSTDSPVQQSPKSARANATLMQDNAPTAPNHLNIVRTKSLPRPPSASSTSSGMRDSMLDDRDDNVKSPVMTETLSVIQEHITDLNAPMNQLSKYDRRDAYDAASSHSSSHPSRSESYIAGSETDEEDTPSITEAEVLLWTPAQAAVYLSDVGVERSHCQIFEDQEISGEVLLGMEQSSLFLAEFELGSIGRRLKTWQKIRSFQDAVARPATPKPSRGSDRRTFYESAQAPRRSNAFPYPLSSSSVSTLPRSIATPENPPTPPQSSLPDSKSIASLEQPVPKSPMKAVVVPASPSTYSQQDQANLENGPRPQRNTLELSKTPIVTTLAEGGVLVSPAKSAHSSSGMRSPFETFTAAVTPRIGSSSRTSIFGHRLSASLDKTATSCALRDSGFTTATKDVDRGYFSSTEAEKSRNLLRKRENSGHLRRPSYTDEERRRSGTAYSIHSRVTSMDSSKNGDIGYDTILSSPGTPPASFTQERQVQMTAFGPSFSEAQSRQSMSSTTSHTTPRHHRRVSEATVSLVSPSPNDSGNATPNNGSPLPTAGSLAKAFRSARSNTVRSISHAVTGKERAVLGSPVGISSGPDSAPMAPISRVELSPSVNKSFDSEGAMDLRKDPNGRLPSASARRKGKKHTSAYLKGLEKKTPQQQILGSDCSGWMKKKNTRLMTTWKPRLFVLRGRRLSYYYANDDQEERGLIDIFGHRVLPANNERLTGLHASLTGAAPVVPPKPTSLPGDSHDVVDGEDEMFIFKLVPPRAGMSKAVNFTKPTIHYFAVESLAEGRRWMAALMKATIDRDESGKVITSYALKTISLAKARQMRQRPPALMNSDDDDDNDDAKEGSHKGSFDTTEGLNGIDIDITPLGDVVPDEKSLLVNAIGDVNSRKVET